MISLYDIQNDVFAKDNTLYVIKRVKNSKNIGIKMIQILKYRK